MKAQRIFAIDPGTKHTGVAYGTDKVLLKADLIEWDRAFVGEDRLYHMALRLVDMICEVFRGSKNNLVVFEDYGYGSRFFNVEVAELMGVIKFLLMVYAVKAEVLFVAPNTVKFQIVGKGRAKKVEVGRTIKKMYPVVDQKELSTHEADAVAIYVVGKRYNDNVLPADVMRKLKGRRFQNVKSFDLSISRGVPVA